MFEKIRPYSAPHNRKQRREYAKTAKTAPKWRKPKQEREGNPAIAALFILCYLGVAALFASVIF